MQSSGNNIPTLQKKINDTEQLIKDLNTAKDLLSKPIFYLQYNLKNRQQEKKQSIFNTLISKSQQHPDQITLDVIRSITFGDKQPFESCSPEFLEVLKALGSSAQGMSKALLGAQIQLRIQLRIQSEEKNPMQLQEELNPKKQAVLLQEVEQTAQDNTSDTSQCSGSSTSFQHINNNQSQNSKRLTTFYRFGNKSSLSTQKLEDLSQDGSYQLLFDQINNESELQPRDRLLKERRKSVVVQSHQSSSVPLQQRERRHSVGGSIKDEDYLLEDSRVGYLPTLKSDSQIGHQDYYKKTPEEIIKTNRSEDGNELSLAASKYSDMALRDAFQKAKKIIVDAFNEASDDLDAFKAALNKALGGDLENDKLEGLNIDTLFEDLKRLKKNKPKRFDDVGSDESKLTADDITPRSWLSFFIDTITYIFRVIIHWIDHSKTVDSDTSSKQRAFNTVKSFSEMVQGQRSLETVQEAQNSV